MFKVIPIIFVLINLLILLTWVCEYGIWNLSAISGKLGMNVHPMIPSLQGDCSADTEDCNVRCGHKLFIDSSLTQTSLHMKDASNLFLREERRRKKD